MAKCPTCGHDDGNNAVRPLKQGMSRYMNPEGKVASFNNTDEEFITTPEKGTGVKWVREDVATARKQKVDADATAKKAAEIKK